MYIYNYIYICNYLQILLIILPIYIYISYFINAEDWNINASSLATQEAGTTTAQAAARKLSCAGCGDWRICLRWLAVPGCPCSILADPRTHTHTDVSVFKNSEFQWFQNVQTVKNISTKHVEWAKQHIGFQRIWIRHPTSQGMWATMPWFEKRPLGVPWFTVITR